jgi:hypothetical protein
MDRDRFPATDDDRVWGMGAGVAVEEAGVGTTEGGRDPERGGLDGASC